MMTGRFSADAEKIITMEAQVLFYCLNHFLPFIIDINYYYCTVERVRSQAA